MQLQLNHISTLARMLSSVRKAYLNVDSRNPPLLRHTNRTIDISGDQSWNDIRNLTNEERDQIDLQARVILSRCKDRVTQLEELEKSFQTKEATLSEEIQRSTTELEVRTHRVLHV